MQEHSVALATRDAERPQMQQLEVSIITNGARTQTQQVKGDRRYLNTTPPDAHPSSRVHMDPRQALHVFDSHRRLTYQRLRSRNFESQNLRPSHPATSLAEGGEANVRWHEAPLHGLAVQQDFRRITLDPRIRNRRDRGVHAGCTCVRGSRSAFTHTGMRMATTTRVRRNLRSRRTNVPASLPVTFTLGRTPGTAICFGATRICWSRFAASGSRRSRRNGSFTGRGDACRGVPRNGR